MNPILNVFSITKTFGNLIANDNITFEVNKGEVLAILGENGAGKTTLMNILFGHYTPDKGKISFEGQQMTFGNTGNAISLGIGMVHQHFTLAENLTVLDNIIIGQQSLLNLSLPRKAAKQKLTKLSESFGLPIDPDSLVVNLSVSEKQRLEILKTLYRNCKLLILDEPTAALTPQETETLFKTIRKMVSLGLSVILISHKLNEILSVSDRIIVLRNGKVVGQTKTSGANRNTLAKMIVGKTVNYPKKEKLILGNEFMRIENISCHPSNESNSGLSNVNLKLNGGQILGIAGVAGNGQVTLAKVLAGHAKPNKGKIFINNKLINSISPKSFMNHGIAYIPEDRNKDGLVGDMSVWENSVMTETNRIDISNKFGWMNEANCLNQANDICDVFDVRTQSIFQPARLLSGGNVQKLLIGRWLSRNPKILIACQPTRGLDEGAIASVQKLLLSSRSKGNAVLLITEDLDELLSISDYISVMYRGKISNQIETNKLNRLKVGLMMAGENFNV